jgi:peptidoglycan/xylan/chitin deacetylase (PgdA/CDA1 family)
MTRRLTLTFDNGPRPARTQWVLDVLAQRNLPAVFFMVGARVAAPGGRAAASAVRAAGHRIGNHTMNHDTPLGDVHNAEQEIAEIKHAERELGELLAPQKLFRPNGGGGRLGKHLLSAAAIDYLRDNGYTVVTWNAVPRDWFLPTDSWIARANQMIAAQDWTVLVLHDVYGGVAHLPRFLDGLDDSQIEFVDSFPPDLLPIRDGTPAPGLGAFYEM